MNFSILWRAGLEISLVAILFYYFYLALRGTRAFQVMKGIFILLFFVYLLAEILELSIITFILTKIFAVAVLVFVVLFQPEIRKVFATLGRSHFRHHYQGLDTVSTTLSETIAILKNKYIGALIVISRQNSLQPYIDTGVFIDAVINMDLITTIFTNRTPLHDGAVILDGDRIKAASCLLPLTQKSSFSRSLGTRHRAAIGLTEETDAIVLIVSEESGSVSIASGGKISFNIDMNTLKKFLCDIYHYDEPKNDNFMIRFLKKYISIGVKEN